MPVVTILAAPHPSVEALLLAVADAIADALDLADGDIIVTHVASGATAASGADAAVAASGWPLVSIHGSDRGRERMEAARSEAEAAVRAWCADNDVECEGVWTQWLLPMP